MELQDIMELTNLKQRILTSTQNINIFNIACMLFCKPSENSSTSFSNGYIFTKTYVLHPLFFFYAHIHILRVGNAEN